MHTLLPSVFVTIVVIVQTCCCIDPKSVHTCGEPGLILATRIANGDEADSTDWPWHAAIFLRKNDANDYICGATLVGQFFVVTGAHCVVNKNTKQELKSNLLTVHFGRQYLNESSEWVQERQVKDVIIHPDYSYESVHNDIALLSLKTEVQFTNHVLPICLKTSSQNDFKGDDLVGKYGVIVGWGKTESGYGSMTLKTASLPVIDYIECLKSDRDFFGQLVSYEMFCAGYNNGTTACNGDSGGGMFFREDDKWMLRGIVSFSAQKADGFTCNYEKYASFTNVQKYISWIRNITNDRISMIDVSDASEALWLKYNNIRPTDLEGYEDPPVKETIVGGNEVSIANFRYQLSLRENGYHICGASVISGNWALSAAHCIEYPDTTEIYSLRGGSANRLSGGVIFAVAQIVNHPQYRVNTSDNDVSVLRSTTSFSGAYISPIAIVPSGTNFGEGTISIVSGWGLTSTGGYLSTYLRAVYIPVVSLAGCRNLWLPIPITDNMVCAGEPGRGSCDADSGGPLVTGGRQFGTVSWGAIQCGALPGVYTNIGAASVSNFIRSTTGVSGATSGGFEGEF